MRPWQHVLDCLNGYLLLADALLDGRLRRRGVQLRAGHRVVRPRRRIATSVAALWGTDARVELDDGPHAHEAGLLALDSRKAELAARAGRTACGCTDALAWTVEWAQKVARRHGRRAARPSAQVREYLELAGRRA